MRMMRTSAAGMMSLRNTSDPVNPRAAATSLLADLEELSLLASASRVGSSAFLAAGGGPALVAALRAASAFGADGGNGDGGEGGGEGAQNRSHGKRRRRLRPRLVLAALRASRAL